MADDWHMPRPGKECIVCAHIFEAGEDFQACLYDTPQGYERRDYCSRCAPSIAPPPIGNWTTRRPETVSKITHALDYQAIYTFFRQLDETDQPEKIRLRFILALLLWRKKVLKLERSVTVDQREVWEFRLPATEELHRVERPALVEEQIEQLSNQLEQLLVGEPATSDTTSSTTEEQTND